MAGVNFQIKFFYQDILFVDSLAYLPRDQAAKIDGLKLQQKPTRISVSKFEARSQQKKSEYDENQMVEENQDDNQIEDNEVQEEGQAQQSQQDMDIEQNDDPEPEDQEVQINGSQNINYDEDDDDEQDDLENDISSISRSISNFANLTKYKTKRQKGQLDNFMELPSKRPRKENKRVDEATQLLKKEQKQRKRKQYIKKMMEVQEKQTFQKILNEAGRKFKQREQKQLKQQLQKQSKAYHNLGDIPKIITKNRKVGEQMNQRCEQIIYLHKTKLFDERTLWKPEIKMGQICEICNQNKGKYKTKYGKYFCSVPCYKQLSTKV